MNQLATRLPAHKTGINGLDDILIGGFARERLFLVEGVPGSGKTTLAMQFLLEGARIGESVLYVTLSESTQELQAVAESHEWDLSGVTIRELVSTDANSFWDDENTMFHPSEVELGDTLRGLLDDVERLQPTRIVLDSLSELRLLAGTALRYRRQILALKQFFAKRGSTVLLLDDLTSSVQDLQIHSIAHGVLRLEQLNREYGAERRRLMVLKYRGVAFRGGYHDYVIHKGGLQVYARLIARDHRLPLDNESLSSGIEQMDQLLGGGIERGSSTLLMGAAGTGKSTLAALFCAEAAERGQVGAMFLFDESINMLLTRCDGLGVDLRRHVTAGRVVIQPIDPAELSPGEFIHAIRQAVDSLNATVVVIDSLNGYLNAMPDERFLIVQLHELLAYLGNSAVATLLVCAQQGLIGDIQSPVDASYLADIVVLMRYFEERGEVRQAISVMKKRGGPHERTIREFKMQSGRISIGEPLRRFQGVLTGAPTFATDLPPLPAGNQA